MTAGPILYIGFAIAALVWPLSATLNVVFFDGVSFTEELIFPDGKDAALRFAFGLCSIGFGVFAQCKLTKSSRNETETAERERRLRQLMDNVDGVFWMVSPDYEELIYVSPAYESIFGRPVKALYEYRKDWIDAIHPDDGERIRETMRRDRGNGGFRETCRIMRPDGEVRWIQVKSFPILNGDGELYRIAGLAIDVTDRKVTEEEVRILNLELEKRVSLSSTELELSELRYRTLASALPVGIFQLDAQSDTVYMNPRCCEIIGMTEEEGLSGWPNALHPEDRDRIQEKWLRHVENGETFGDEYRFVHADGTLVWVFGQIVSQKDLDGKTTGFVGVLTDITELKYAEERIRASEERFHTLAKFAPTGIFRADAQGKYIYANEAYCQISGLTLSETFGSDWTQGLHVEDHDRIARAWQEAIEDSRDFETECRFLRKDGTERWVLVHAMAERNDANEVVSYVGTATDITWRKQSEIAIRESEKIAATGRMAAQIAHEINNPLAGIANAFTLVKDAVPKDHEHYKYVKLIENEVSRIAEIVRHMFEMYEPSRRSPRELDLNEVFSDMTLMFEASLHQAGVRLEFDVLNGPMDVTLPDIYFRQIVNNLVANAIEASPPGGRVLVRTEAHEEELHLLVSDEGAGIPLDIRQDIFEPFFSTKGGQAGKSMGLGLALSQNMAKAMEGSIEILKSDHNGTTFLLRIPCNVSTEVLRHV